MNDYVTRFFKEKDLDLEDGFSFETSEGTFHWMPYGVVVEAIKATTGSERKIVEHTLRVLDFQNRSVTTYLQHLGRGLAEQMVAR